MACRRSHLALCWSLGPLSSPASQAKSETPPWAPLAPCVGLSYSIFHMGLQLMQAFVSDWSDIFSLIFVLEHIFARKRLLVFDE